MAHSSRSLRCVRTHDLQRRDKVHVCIHTQKRKDKGCKASPSKRGPPFLGSTVLL